MPGEYHQLDKDKWTELPDRHINKSGNVHTSKEYVENYEVRVFVRNINSSKL